MIIARNPQNIRFCVVISANQVAILQHFYLTITSESATLGMKLGFATISNGSFFVDKRHPSVTTCVAPVCVPPVCYVKSDINAVSDRQLMPVGVDAVFDLAGCQGCFDVCFTCRGDVDPLKTPNHSNTQVFSTVLRRLSSLGPNIPCNLKIKCIKSNTY